MAKGDIYFFTGDVNLINIHDDYYSSRSQQLVHRKRKDLLLDLGKDARDSCGYVYTHMYSLSHKCVVRVETRFLMNSMERLSNPELQLQ